MVLADLHKKQGQQKGGLVRSSRYREVHNFLYALKRWRHLGGYLQDTLHAYETFGKPYIDKMGCKAWEPGPPRAAMLKEILAMKKKSGEPFQQKKLLLLAVKCGVNINGFHHFETWLDSTWGNQYDSRHDFGTAYRTVLWKLLVAAQDALECELRHEAMPPLGKFVLKEARKCGIRAIRVVGGRKPTEALFSLQSGVLPVKRRTISKWLALD